MKAISAADKKVILKNRSLARHLWALSPDSSLLLSLRELSQQYHFSIPEGDLKLLSQNWYVTHVGLIRLAKRKRCAGIDVRPVPRFCDPTASRFSFKATVYTSRECLGFTGYGDADPSNVSPLVRGAEMRVAETRAVNRA